MLSWMLLIKTIADNDRIMICIDVIIMKGHFLMGDKELYVIVAWEVITLIIVSVGIDNLNYMGSNVRAEDVVSHNNISPGQRAD